MQDIDKQNLIPGKYFPAHLTPPTKEDILGLLEWYGFVAQGDIRLLDTSHAETDIRLNYFVDNKFVLRLCNAPDLTDDRLAGLNRLIDRYCDYGLICPRFLPKSDGRFICQWQSLSCYLSEYVDMPLADQVNLNDSDALWQEVVESVAGFAERYRGVDLMNTYGMYSLFDLSPFDKSLGIDEKQQNFDDLIAKLNDIGQTDLVNKLNEKYAQFRQAVKDFYRTLPRCVFQADESFTNVLIDQNQHFVGLIDFNLAGTEVIVNQLANLGGGFDEDNLELIGAQTRLSHALAEYKAYQDRALAIYHASDIEKKAIWWYTWIALVSGWPQVCFFKAHLDDELKDEILDLLGLLADLPLEGVI